MATFTTNAGIPVDDDNNSLTAGPQGPVLLMDHALIEKMAHFDHERIPERVVHAKGAGAHGYFEVTADVSKYTKAKFLNQVGKRTPVFVRFSNVAGEKGSADAVRDPRGFAVKHYTEDGIYDMVGNNTPVFFVRDPQKFPDFIHSQKRNPQTNLHDANMFWDFLSLVPESVHQVTILLSDRGTPRSHRHMNGYSSHTFRWVNEQGEGFFVKLHYKTDQGNETFSNEEAAEKRKEDPDSATRDLFESIERGDFPSWTAQVQIMPEADAAKYKWNILDVTKVWPHADYPCMTYGKLVLNRNPSNYFAETEQSAFSPGHLVPGIEASFDKMLQARIFSYPDTHSHRLGPNYLQLPINCPINGVANYQRDGFMTIHSGGPGPNYWPNSVNGTPEPELQAAQSQQPVSGAIGRFPQGIKNDDFVQAGMLFSKAMNDEQRDHLIHNIVGHLKDARKDIQDRMVAIFSKAHEDYGRRVREGLDAMAK